MRHLALSLLVVASPLARAAGGSTRGGAPAVDVDVVRLAAKKAPDTAPPAIVHTPVASCPVAAPCVIRAQITDPSGVFDPTLLFRLHGTAAFDRVAMKAVAAEKDVYEGVVPAALAAAGDVDYLIEAFDVEGNGPARAGTEDAPLVVKRPVVVVAPPPPPPPPPAVVEDDNTGLVVAAVVGSVVVVTVAAVGIGVAVYALRPPAPTTVDVVVKGPTPFAAGAP